jgi:sporulation protein YlmC with PRC-barrel domain
MKYTVKTALVAVLFGFGLQALAADPPGVQPTAPGTRPAVTTEPGQMAAAHMMPSKKLVGLNVKNTQGEKLGSIEDLVVAMNDSKVTHAVVSVGGALGIGTKYHPVPFSDLKLHQTGKDEFEFVLNTTKDRLDAAPTIEKDKWEEFSSPEFRTKVDNYYRSSSATVPMTTDRLKETR